MMYLATYTPTSARVRGEHTFTVLADTRVRALRLMRATLLKHAELTNIKRNWFDPEGVKVQALLTNMGYRDDVVIVPGDEP